MDDKGFLVATDLLQSVWKVPMSLNPGRSLLRVFPNDLSLLLLVPGMAPRVQDSHCRSRGEESAIYRRDGRYYDR